MTGDVSAGNASTKKVVIVGAGPAGIAAADALRAEGHAGEILIFGEERHAPYDRPPLSKQILAGTWLPEKAQLRSDDQLAAAEVSLHLSVKVASVDVEAHQVTLESGEQVAYDALILASGVTARELPFGHHLEGVHVMRTLDDALSLQINLETSQHLAVIGAGFLGAEVAAVARSLGKEVTMIDPLELPMQNVVGDEVGSMIADLHRHHGVNLELGHGVSSIEDSSGRATGVTLDDGRTVPADAALVAVGARPAVDWLRSSSVPLTAPNDPGAGGVRCDSSGRATDDVWAIGDVAAWWDPTQERYVRVEHRMTANEHARSCARDILGLTPTAPKSLPYFWSDQYDLKLRSFGFPSRQAGFHVIEGDLEDRRFVATYTDESDRIVGIIGAGMFKAMNWWRQQILDGQTLSDALSIKHSAENPA
ncbi:NAD(P)/FAD-dependent oxidoreductase [Brevibacterium aurantiacum]|uniref:NAD(P)/FAD-dependent oxidoreductase n=1 Tax=Brevibacterium aurantiacum TaxID=273384 RepID=UPI001436A141|nr:FAD/NAD(P)-binding oxidoreductase [Brevibacterium aurantiacum]